MTCPDCEALRLRVEDAEKTLGETPEAILLGELMRRDRLRRGLKGRLVWEEWEKK